MSKQTKSNRVGHPGLISALALAAACTALMATPVRAAAADQRVAVLELGQPWGKAQLPVARFTPATAAGAPLATVAQLPAGASVGAAMAGMVSVPATAQLAQASQWQNVGASDLVGAASSTPSVAAVAPPTAATPAPAPGAAAPQSWEVRTSDVTLSRTLERWAAAAGYRLKWDAARNFLISAPSTFSGDFEEALSQALSTPGVRLSDYPLEACIYPNTPPLARITRQGEQTRECMAAGAVTSAAGSSPTAQQQ